MMITIERGNFLFEPPTRQSITGRSVCSVTLFGLTFNFFNKSAADYIFNCVRQYPDEVLQRQELEEALNQLKQPKPQ